MESAPREAKKKERNKGWGKVDWKEQKYGGCWKRERNAGKGDFKVIFVVLKKARKILVLGLKRDDRPI